MAKSRLVKINKRIADTVTESFKKIEKTVLDNYRKIEDAFVDRYLTHDNETVEQAKKRIKNN